MPLRSYSIKCKKKRTEKDVLLSIGNPIELETLANNHNIINDYELHVKCGLKRRRESSPAPTIKVGKIKNVDDLFERYFQHTSSSVEGKIYHSGLPSFNLNSSSIGRCEDLQVQPSYSLVTPKPIYISPKHSDAYDICKRRTYIYNVLQNRLARSAKAYKSTICKIRDLRQLEKEHKYHRGIFDFAERLEQNPDSSFYGSYDFYYSGGSLCLLGNENVVHVDGENLDYLNVSHFPYVNSKTCASLEKYCSDRFSRSSEIFEVSYLPAEEVTNNLRFSLRQRNAVALCSWNPYENEIKSLVEFKSKNVSFISSSYNPQQPNKMLITNLKQKVRLYDINYEPPVQTAIYHHNDDQYINSWNTIKHWKDNNFLFANQHTLNILDIRTSAHEWLNKVFDKPTTTNECDSITALAVSNYDNLVYVATNHKLHCIDLRRLGSEFEVMGGICCWTHMIEFGPTLISTIRIKNKELIALAGPLPSDLRICELSRKRILAKSEVFDQKYIYKSTCLPFQPPSLEEALDGARLAGKCLDPKADMKRRIRNCNIGLQFYQYDCEEYAKSTFLLTANSIGDVFAQTLLKREKFEKEYSQEERISKKSTKQLSTYAKQIIKEVPDTLNYTDIVNLNTMRKILGCANLSYCVKDEAFSEHDSSAEQVPDINATKPIEKQRGKLGGWHKSLQSLHNYKDALVKDLLAIWDIEFDRDYSINLKEEDFKAKPDRDTIVHAWLKKNYDEPPMTSVPTNNLRSTSTLEDDPTNIDLSQTIFSFHALPDEAQSTQIYAPANVTGLNSTFDILNYTLDRPSALSIPELKKPKPKSKKSKYVKGFA